MKISKICCKFLQTKQLNDMTKSITPCPIVYDSKNITKEEFRQYVHWLSENRINRTFYEPDKFITKSEREALEQRKADLDKYHKFVKNLRENNINRTFFC